MLRWWYSGFLTFLLTVPSASSRYRVACSQSGPLNPTPSMLISPAGVTVTAMVLFMMYIVMGGGLLNLHPNALTDSAEGAGECVMGAVPG
ncbi:MAG: hypothetical protein JWM16_1767 [Verrucomicrobiales bacterium]|nr:hypothetical protein [Verrucomicrobiales bacterium]